MSNVTNAQALVSINGNSSSLLLLLRGRKSSPLIETSACAPKREEEFPIDRKKQVPVHQ